MNLQFKHKPLIQSQDNSKEIKKKKGNGNGNRKYENKKGNEGGRRGCC
jgi:hypothetical protein